MLIKINALTINDCKSLVQEHCKSSKECRYKSAWEYFTKSYERAVANQLRMNPKTWTIRDNNGILSQPVRLNEWPECTPNDALIELARSVWCDAVGMRNRATM